MLPQRTYRLRSDKSSGETRASLLRNTSQEDNGYIGSFADHNKRFGGKVTKTGFQISTNVGYRNDFKPQISGDFTVDESLLVHFRLRKSVRIFIIIVSIPLSVASLIICSVIISNPQVISTALFSPLLMLSAIFGMAHIGFWAELSRSKKRFDDAVGGELVRAN